MYWFTCWCDSTIPDAIYNGRFGFVRNLSKEDARKYVSGIKNGIDRRDILDHELAHKEVFMLSKTAMLLQGLRLIARINGRVLKKYNSVEQYYRARSIFFRLMYKLHEDIAYQLENNMGDVLIDGEHVNSIMAYDRKVEKEWEENGIKYKNGIKKILIYLGRKYCSHFTLIIGDWDGDTWHEQNYSTSGFINDIGDLRKDDTKFYQVVKKLSKYLQVETWTNNDVEEDWKWMIIKFKTEYKDWREQKSGNFDFEMYIHQAVKFSAEWSKLKSFSVPREIAEIIVDNLDSPNIPVVPNQHINDPKFKKMINLFYIHGN